MLAAAIVRAGTERGGHLAQPTNVTEVAGQGISGTAGGREVRLGRASWAGGAEAEPWVRAARRRARLDGTLTVFIAVDGQPAGVLLLEDRLRPDARQTIVAMGARGASASSEAADAVLTVDQLGRFGEVAAIARRARRIALESVLAGMGMSLAAMTAAAAGLLPAVWGALLQEVIDVVVILNALRALEPPAPEVRLTAADTELTRRFRAEHLAIRADLEQLRTAAQTLGQPSTMDRVRRLSPRGQGRDDRSPEPAVCGSALALHARDTVLAVASRITSRIQTNIATQCLDK